MIEKTDFNNFHVIFITAHDDYAIKAFKTNAVDYLLKPIDIEELISAVAKAKNIIDSKLNLDVYKKLALINSDEKNNHNSKTSKASKRLMFPVNDGIEFYDADEIVLIKAEGSYSVLSLVNGKKVTISKNTSQIEEMLDSTIFFRTHKSYIINLSHVKKYNKSEGGSIEMTDGTSADLSRRKKDEFLMTMNPNYISNND
ncbi:MAG: LytTR family DNA-binding domain-containing protein [Bacteroidota bacterium]